MRFERLIWLMPLAYAAHIGEETAAGFPAWAGAVLGRSIGDGSFVLANALFLAVLLALTLWASLSTARIAAFVLMSWASGNLFWNFVFHLATTIAFGRYSPGLASAVLLYAPLSLLVAAASLRSGRLRAPQLAGAFALGGALMSLVIRIGLVLVAP